MPDTEARETIVACDDCGAAQIAYVRPDGVTANGQVGCRRCGGGEFEELAVAGMRVDDAGGR